MCGRPHSCTSSWPRCLRPRGQWEEASVHVSASRKAANARPTPEALGAAALAEASLARARGWPAEVVAAISPLTKHHRHLPATVARGWGPAMIGSLIETGDVDRAAHELDALRATAVQHS